MTGPFVLRPAELGDADAPDLAEAMEAARRLEAALVDATPQPSGALSDRVMAALATEPVPATTGFLVPVRRRGLLRGFGDSVRQAWASIGAGRPALGRASALAYVLVVLVAGASVTGAATVGVAGALGIIGPSSTESPVPATPTPTLAPAPTLAPSRPPDSLPPPVGPTPTPSETPGESEGPDDHGGNSGPGSSDDDGGNSGPGGGGDDSGSSGSGSGDDDSSSGSGSGDD